VSVAIVGHKTRSQMHSELASL